MRVLIRFIVSIVPILLFAVFCIPNVVVSAGVQVTAIVPGICGNDLTEVLEQCDGTDLAGASCTSLGYQSGTLECSPTCSFNVSQCTPIPVVVPPSGGGGGGGGGGGSSPPSAAGQVVFRGKAYPQSDVTLLKDGSVVATTKAGADANFELTVSNVSVGTYNFGIWAEDAKGIRSTTHNFSISIGSGGSTLVSGIFLPPTIGLDKIEVKRGDPLTIFGQSQGASVVSIVVNSDTELLKKVTADASGSWTYKLDTLELEMGDHHTKARSASETDISTFSTALAFKVGTQNVAAPGTTKTPIKVCAARGDLNDDCKVNLVDFSILAFWYNKASPLPKVDLNKDGKVNLVDFSILAYNWTG